MAKRLETTVGCSEPLVSAAGEIKTQRNGSLTTKQAECCAGVDTGGRMNLTCARPEHNGNGYAVVFVCVGVHAGKLETAHCLPATEGQLSVHFDAGKEWFFHTRRTSLRAYVRQLRSMGNEAATAQRHPLARVRARLCR